MEIYDKQKKVRVAGTVQMKYEDLRTLDQIDVYERQKVVWSAGTVQMKRNDEIIEKKVFFGEKKTFASGSGEYHRTEINRVKHPWI